MKITKAVIPCAGLGTRMIPATKSVPKEMLPIGTIPAIHHIVKEAVDSGITDILIITNRTKGAIEDYFDYLPEVENRLNLAGKEDDAKLIHNIADMANFYFIRQKETAGLGHAVYRAKNFVGHDPFAVLLGDDIMTSDAKPVTRQLIDIYEKHGAPTVGVKFVPDDKISKYCSLGVSALNDHKDCYKVLDLIEKPSIHEIMSNLAILGRYVLTHDIFDILENTKKGVGREIQLTDALNALCKKRDMLAFEFDGTRFDTGSRQGYLQAILHFAIKDPDLCAFLKDYLHSNF